VPFRTQQHSIPNPGNPSQLTRAPFRRP
jgi:hypothetical protein